MIDLQKPATGQPLLLLAPAGVLLPMRWTWRRQGIGQLRESRAALANSQRS